MTPRFNRVSVYHGTTLVALVAVDADEPTDVQLEQAFRATQNLDGSWSQGEFLYDGVTRNRDYNPFVTRIAPLHVHEGRTYGLRSSMVGDIFELKGLKYSVESVGFVPVN